jgi:hypothetical protein
MKFKERNAMKSFLLRNKKHEIYNTSKSLSVTTRNDTDAQNYVMSEEKGEVYNPENVVELSLPVFEIIHEQNY